MNNKIRLVLVVLLLAAFGYLGYVNWPRPKEISYTVAKPKWEIKTSSYTTTIQVDGKPREVTIEVPNKTVYYISEHKTRKVPLSWLDYLKGCVIGVGLLYIAALMVILLGALYRDKKAGGKSTASTRDTQARVDKMTAFAMGLVVGFMSTGQLKVPTTVTAKEQVEPFTDPIPQADEFTGEPVNGSAPMQKDEQTPAVVDPGTPTFTPNPRK
jgi:hypothetical protein